MKSLRLGLGLELELGVGWLGFKINLKCRENNRNPIYVVLVGGILRYAPAFAVAYVYPIDSHAPRPLGKSRY